MAINDLIATLDSLASLCKDAPGEYAGWLQHHRDLLTDGSEEERQVALRWLRAGLRAVAPSRSVQVRRELRRQPEAARLLDRLEELNVVRLFPCPCCGYLTNPAQQQSFNVCPVCWWEDDGTVDAGEKSGANRISLEEGRTNFERGGACTPEGVEYVRRPLEDEYPESVQ